MFEVGFTEIILILGIALLVLGPEKLPRIAAQVGRWAGRARAMARNLKDQLDDEVLKAEQTYSRPEPDYKPPYTAPPPGTPHPTADVAAGAAGIAAAGQAAAAPVQAVGAAADDFGHRDDPFLRDGDPPLPPVAAPAEAADTASADVPAADDSKPP
jgi:sec-independent protein translocase protein TatB